MHKHDTDWISLVSGLIFLAIGAGAIISAETGLLFDGRWLVPAMLLVVAVGILASIRGRASLPAATHLTEAERAAMSELPDIPA